GATIGPRTSSANAGYRNPSWSTSSSTCAHFNRMIIDYHMHTALCRHAVGEPLEYARAGAAAGLEEICMTCHCPMPEWFDQWPRMRAVELPQYVAMVLEAA